MARSAQKVLTFLVEGAPSWGYPGVNLPPISLLFPLCLKQGAIVEMPVFSKPQVGTSGLTKDSLLIRALISTSSLLGE